MNIDDLTLGQAKQLAALVDRSKPRKFDGLLRVIENDKDRGGLFADQALAELALLTRKAFDFERVTTPFGGTKFKVVCR